MPDPQNQRKFIKCVASSSVATKSFHGIPTCMCEMFVRKLSTASANAPLGNALSRLPVVLAIFCHDCVWYGFTFQTVLCVCVGVWATPSRFGPRWTNKTKHVCVFFFFSSVSRDKKFDSRITNIIHFHICEPVWARLDLHKQAFCDSVGPAIMCVFHSHPGRVNTFGPPALRTI